MNLSEIGKIADKFWSEIPEHFPFVILDVHVVMPNHVHGIIIIDKPEDRRNDTKNDERNVETQNFASLQHKNKFGPQSQNLASIIRGYKTGVTKYARNNNINFTWQSRFHDHIIRNSKSYQRIKHYIINNPGKWLDDSLNNE